MRLIIVILIFPFFSVYSQAIENNIFGFATSNTFTYCDVKDTSFVNKVKAINPKILRFPGGAVGNFYHYGKNGYGFDFIEIDKYHDGKFPKRSRGLESSRKKKNHNYDYINDFIFLAQRTNAKAVLVANPFVQNDDIILMIERLKQNNIEVVGVELGSELSNRSYYTKGYTIDDYIMFADNCSRKIKGRFPEISTAVVAAPLGKGYGHRHNIWNEKLAALDFYDAIIIHSYAKVTKGYGQYGQMISEEVEGKNKAEAFEIYKNRAINYLTIDYPKEVEEYITIFSKPIWVTEWNLQMSKVTGNTLFQSLFVVNYILELFSNKDFSDIKLTTFHNLGGRDFSASIFSFYKETLNIQSTFFPFKMLSEIFEQNIVRIERQKEHNVFFYKCFNKDNAKVLTYIIDWEKKEFIRKQIDNIMIVEQIRFFSENLYDLSNPYGMLRADTIKELLND